MWILACNVKSDGVHCGVCVCVRAFVCHLASIAVVIFIATTKGGSSRYYDIPQCYEEISMKTFYEPCGLFAVIDSVHFWIPIIITFEILLSYLISMLLFQVFKTDHLNEMLSLSFPLYLKWYGIAVFRNSTVLCHIYVSIVALLPSKLIHLLADVLACFD